MSVEKEIVNILKMLPLFCRLAHENFFFNPRHIFLDKNEFGTAISHTKSEILTKS